MGRVGNDGSSVDNSARLSVNDARLLVRELLDQRLGEREAIGTLVIVVLAVADKRKAVAMDRYEKASNHRESEMLADVPSQRERGEQHRTRNSECTRSNRLVGYSRSYNLFHNQL